MKVLALMATALLASVVASPSHAQATGNNHMISVYVGTYTGPNSKGIYLFDFDSQTGQLQPRGLAGETANPSFLALHPSGRFLYSASETGTFAGRKTGSLCAFAIDPTTGQLTLLNQQPSEGQAPCHVGLDPKGNVALVANYSSGTVSAYKVAQDGRLSAPTTTQHEGKGPNARRQERAHAHSINVSPDGQYALACDLGIDKIIVYRLDATNGQLQQHNFVSTAPGAGPRHLAFSPDRKIAYVINELDGTLGSYAWDAAKGTLTAIATVSTLPEGYSGEKSCAEVQVHPNGKFVYGSNRGHDSIAIFSTDPSGKLTPLGHQPTLGKHPRNFTIDPTGQYLIAANKDSDNLVVFRIDPQTGKLAHVQTVPTPSPTCVKFLRR